MGKSPRINTSKSYRDPIRVRTRSVEGGDSTDITEGVFGGVSSESVGGDVGFSGEEFESPTRDDEVGVAPH